MGEVQARSRAPGPPDAARVGRPVQPLGRSRFVNDFSLPEHGEAIYTAGVRAFRDYSPVAYSPDLGLYRSVRWGRHLELFFLDQRSFRSGKATAACGNDLAPTAPQAVREAFAALAPGLRNPVPPACLAAINDPSRTMLGARQYEVFTNAIKASKATWKVVVNQVPIQQYYALPYDRWEGYAAERERLLRFLQQNTKNVVFLTTDTHANLINEVRFRTLGVTPEGSGCGRSSPAPLRRTPSRRRSTASSASRAAAPRSPRSSSSPAPERARDALCRDRHVQLRAGDRHRADAHGRSARCSGQTGP